jgi:hypothetical protein
MRPAGEGDGACFALVAQDLLVARRRGVVGGDVSELPASISAVVRMIALDAATDPLDPAELLDVQADKVAGASRS